MNLYPRHHGFFHFKTSKTRFPEYHEKKMWYYPKRSILVGAVQRTTGCLLVVAVENSSPTESALVTLNYQPLNSTFISTWWVFLALKRGERENTLIMETISTGVWKHNGLTVWDYEVRFGFLQPIITDSQKIYRDNLEEGLENFSWYLSMCSIWQVM